MNWEDMFRALLALVIWREARGEPHEGRVGVANVIRNRVLATHLPDQWEDVIERKWQFSSMTAPGDGMLVQWPKQPDTVFEDCMAIATAAVAGTLEDNTSGSHYYANLAAVPKESSFWPTIANNPEHPKTVVIGHHTFYK
jgi:spore germination cell wall hydrolase CwlJ-like protein